MKLEEYNCKICGNKKFKIISDYKSSNKLFKNKQIVECINCSLKSMHPLINEGDLDEYNKKYYNNAHNNLKLDKLAENFFNSIAKCRFHFLEKFLINKKINIKNILEIGPGRGHFYNQFKENKEKLNYSILETDQNLKDIFVKKNLKVYDHLDNIPENNYDLIIFSHVLEHINNPNTFLKKINSLLKENGVIFIEIPCLDYLYKDIMEPHIHFYDKATLSLLLNKNNLTNHEIFYYGKKISDIKLNPLNKQLKHKFFTLLLKLNFTFLINIKDEKKYSFLNSKYEKIIAEMYEMNSKNDNPSWWIRALITKN